MNMSDTIITFETAKLAKEKGFDLYQAFSYWEGILTNMTPGYPLEDGKTSQENYNKFDRYYAPTQSLLQKWLREVHNIIVYVTPFKDIGDDLNDPIRFKVFTTKTTNSIEYKTYEEALEIGLQEALKLIK